MDTKKKAALLVLWTVFVGGGSILAYYVAGPTVTFIVAALGTVPAVLAGFWMIIVKLSDSGSGSISFGRKTASQLNEIEAFEILCHRLLFEENIRGARENTIRKGATNETDQQTGDSVRLYELVFRRVNLNERVAVLMDLEQEISVDTNSLESLEKAGRSIENLQIIRETRTGDFEEEIEKKKKELAASMYEPMQEVNYDDEGNLVSERTVPPSVYPGGRQNQVESDDGGED